MVRLAAGGTVALGLFRTQARFSSRLLLPGRADARPMGAGAPADRDGAGYRSATRVNARRAGVSDS